MTTSNAAVALSDFSCPTGIAVASAVVCRVSGDPDAAFSCRISSFYPAIVLLFFEYPDPEQPGDHRTARSRWRITRALIDVDLYARVFWNTAADQRNHLVACHGARVSGRAW